MPPRLLITIHVKLSAFYVYTASLINLFQEYGLGNEMHLEILSKKAKIRKAVLAIHLTKIPFYQEFIIEERASNSHKNEP